MERVEEYSRIMMMRSLGREYFDKQLLNKIQEDPDVILRTFNESEVKGESPDDGEDEIDFHRQEVNVLHIACQEGLYMSVKYLLKKFPELTHSQTQAKWTPLMIACEAGHVEIIELLVGKMP